jgi:hypothetical protein
MRRDILDINESALFQDINTELSCRVPEHYSFPMRQQIIASDELADLMQMSGEWLAHCGKIQASLNFFKRSDELRRGVAFN